MEIYTFASKERDEESGLSYFGARYYSSDLSIWLSVDPMSDKYPSLSPYVYCANNPVKLVDPNGEDIKIPGKDGKPISYSINANGNIAWSKNTSDDVKRIGNAMLKTTTGKDQFDKMIDSPVEIHLSISQEERIEPLPNSDDMQLTFGQIVDVHDKDGSLVSEEITIFEGTINTYINHKELFPFSENSPHFLYNTTNLTNEELLGIECAHEDANTSQENYNLRHGNQSNAAIEEAPRAVQNQILKELINAKNNE